MNTKLILESIQKAKKRSLTESQKRDYTTLLENTNKYIKRYSQLNESTQLADVALFKKYGINLLAATIPNIIAPEIVSIQPIN